MKAAVIDRYGGNETIEIRNMPKPLCGPRDVLIRVHAASINPVDWKVRYGQARILTGKRFPKILGNECSGEVVETGPAVTTLKKGDAVIGWPGIRRLGAFAEYACAAEGAAFPIKSISFEQAACLPIAGLTALQALRDKGRISPGKKVLINGASGGVGHFAVQVAKIYGAEVTAVCSEPNLEFARGLGADDAIDYTKDDFAKRGTSYDIVFDAVALRSFGEVRRVLTRTGVYISTLPSAGTILNQYLTGFFTSRKAAAVMVRPNKADLEWMMNSVESGRVKVVINRIYPLSRTKDALAYSETGKTKGKILLKIPG